MAGINLDAYALATGTIYSYTVEGWVGIGSKQDARSQYYLPLYRAVVDYTGASAMTSLTITVRVYSSYSSLRNITVNAALGMESGSGSSSTIVATTSNTFSFNSSGSDISFTFSNLNITPRYGNTDALHIFIYSSDTAFRYIGGPNDSVSATFTTAPITMSLSSSSVTTGNSQVATFTNGSGRYVSVTVEYNWTVLWSGSTTSGSLTIPVSKSWFSSAGVTTYREISVSIKATESSTGTLTDSFYIVAGSDMNPTVGTPDVSIVQASGKPSTNYPNTYLANISKAKIAASVSSGSNASIVSVVLTYTGGSAINMTYNSSTGKYEATTPELMSASTSFTVTAKDGRRYNRSGTDVGGMSTAKTSSAISVVQYTPPSVNIDAGATFRCTQSGSQASGGAYYMAKAASSYYSSLSGNTLLSFFVRIHGSQTTHNLTSGVQAGPLDGTLAARTSYTLEFVIEDKVSPAVIKSFPLGSQIRDVVAIHNSTGTALGVGTTPETAAGSSVEMAMGGKFMVGGFLWGSITRLHDTATDGSQFGQDFLGVDTGVLYDDGNAEAYFIMSSTSGWTHYPVSSTPFKGIRKVLWINSTNILVVILEAAPTVGRIWINYYDGSAWSGWKNHAPA